MAELFRDQLNDLRLLLRHIPDTIPLPLPSEIVYPFVGYTIDEYWFDKIESEEGVVNRDLELAFADRVAQNDTERLISFHKCEPSLEAVVDVIEKYCKRVFGSVQWQQQ